MDMEEFESIEFDRSLKFITIRIDDNDEPEINLGGVPIGEAERIFREALAVLVESNPSVTIIDGDRLINSSEATRSFYSYEIYDEDEE